MNVLLFQFHDMDYIWGVYHDIPPQSLLLRTHDNIFVNVLFVTTYRGLRCTICARPILSSSVCTICDKPIKEIREIRRRISHHRTPKRESNLLEYIPLWVPGLCGRSKCVKLATMICQRCERIYYCSEECQWEHFESHMSKCTK